MHGHLRLRVFERPAVLQPSDHREVAAVARGRLLRIERERRPDLRAVGKREARRRHADDLVRLAVDDDAASDDRRVAVEAPLPNAVADDDDVMAAERLVVAHEAAAERGADAERVEEVRTTRGSPAAARDRRDRRGWRPTTGWPTGASMVSALARQSRKLAGETDSFVNSSRGAGLGQHHRRGPDRRAGRDAGPCDRSG